MGAGVRERVRSEEVQVAFRIQDLMMDVRPGGLQMANPECTCQVTVKPGVERQPATPPAEEPGRGPRPGKGKPEAPDGPLCQDSALPPGKGRRNRMDALADFALLRQQLQSVLSQPGAC